MSKLEDDYVPPTNVNPNDLPFSYQLILSVLNKAISKKIMDLELCSKYCRVIFVLKQLSLSLLGVIKSLSLRGVLLKTHFGYKLTMGCDFFILLCRML
ncbi:valine--trna ligase [Quercus suber]|uniref:Valine--trna ligase n=1 Tax=Quercus suber TaxID=58331 RepID=A0AAW0KFM7_QUESU